MVKWQVLLLDEITVDLDVVARMDLLAFFVDECEEVSLHPNFHFHFCHIMNVNRGSHGSPTHSPSSLKRQHGLPTVLPIVGFSKLGENPLLKVLGDVSFAESIFSEFGESPFLRVLR